MGSSGADLSSDATIMDPGPCLDQEGILNYDSESDNEHGGLLTQDAMPLDLVTSMNPTPSDLSSAAYLHRRSARVDRGMRRRYWQTSLRSLHSMPDTLGVGYTWLRLGAHTSLTWPVLGTERHDWRVINRVRLVQKRVCTERAVLEDTYLRKGISIQADAGDKTTEGEVEQLRTGLSRLEVREQEQAHQEPVWEIQDADATSLYPENKETIFRTSQRLENEVYASPSPGLQLRGGGGCCSTEKLGDDDKVPRAIWYFAGGQPKRRPTVKQLKDLKTASRGDWGPKGRPWGQELGYVVSRGKLYRNVP